MQQNRIPISKAFEDTLNDNDLDERYYNKKRLLRISLLAIFIAVMVSFIAKFLVYLINFITNISFYGKLSIAQIPLTENHLGLWVIFIPIIGGIIIGLMALFGSKAIRGHGIPEAMEQILTNQSKIKPSIMFLKPISSAISIGTGGPFGAEGPIIATGGALGSTMGQIIRITPNERKILLAAGATAGMSAIFGTPVAAILLAIELLLFEFSAKSFIPVAIACITGAAGHHFLFESVPAFSMKDVIPVASNSALFFYGGMGIVMGFISVAVTKITYGFEDLFEKIPIHWMWYPAIGGLFVGVIGYYDPRTLGIGFANITNLLTGNMAIHLVISLCFLKFLSWSISLGSGTSGGTLAPLMTIGGAFGVIFGHFGQHFFPEANINISLAALVGMSALFAGASRAFLTSIVFALEATGQSNALLPLLSTCTGAYFVSYLLMENTIMTEKIARRGVVAPSTYESDILSKIKVEQVLDDTVIIVKHAMDINVLRNELKEELDPMSEYVLLTNDENEYQGIIHTKDIFDSQNNEINNLNSLIKNENLFINEHDYLRKAVELMAKENVDVLPVISKKDNAISGLISYKQILSVYKLNAMDEEHLHRAISLKRKRLKMLARGQRFASLILKRIEK